MKLSSQISLCAAALLLSMAAASPPVAAAPADGIAAIRQKNLLSRAWWNQPEITESLNLTDEQKQKMDAVLLASIQGQMKIQAQQTESRHQFEQALSGGDWSAAQKASEQSRQHAAEAWGKGDDLKIAVFRVLDDHQRQTLASKYPDLVRGSWRGGSAALGRRERMRRAAGTPPAP